MMNRIKTYWGVRNNDNLKISRLRAINLSCLSHIGCFMASDSGSGVVTVACNIARQLGKAKWR